MLLRGLAVVLMSLSLTSPTWAQGKMPTLNLLEQGRMPQYCWGGKRGDPQKYGALPQYNIPKVCGKRMNHLCNGHVYLIAAQRIGLPPRDKKFFAQKAGGEFGYTQDGMTPECPLRAEVEGSIALARLLQGSP
jgi:hypothetical protein